MSEIYETLNVKGNTKERFLKKKPLRSSADDFLNILLDNIKEEELDG